MSLFLGILAVVLGLPGALAAIHLTVLSVASVFYREPEGPDQPSLSFLVVIPAHNEAAVIGGMLDELMKHARHRDRVLVVADRCSDDTASIALSKGAHVLEPPATARPGRAATIAEGILHSKDEDWDAVVMIDADSYIEAGFFEALEAAFARGYRAVQPRSEHVRAPGVLARVSEAAFALQGVSIPRGRSRLGVSARLRGSGMSLDRETALTRPFGTEGVSEDMFYYVALLLDGYVVGHVDRARLSSLSAPSISEGAKQRMRWETGRLAAAREFAGQLFRARTLPAFEAGLHLVTPPLAVAVFSLGVGSVVAWIADWETLAIIFAAGIGALALDVGIGLIESRASWRTWAALLVAPIYVVWKTGIQLAAALNMRNADKAWQPTQRE